MGEDVICPEELPGGEERKLVARLEDSCVVFEGHGKRFRLCAKPLAVLARAAYHFALKLARGEEGCVEPAKGAEPFSGKRNWSEEKGFAEAVEFMVLSSASSFAKLYTKVSKVEYDPSTGTVWTT